MPEHPLPTLTPAVAHSALWAYVERMERAAQLADDPDTFRAEAAAELERVDAYPWLRLVTPEQIADAQWELARTITDGIDRACEARRT